MLSVLDMVEFERNSENYRVLVLGLENSGNLEN